MQYEILSYFNLYDKTQTKGLVTARGWQRQGDCLVFLSLPWRYIWKIWSVQKEMAWLNPWWTGKSTNVFLLSTIPASLSAPHLRPSPTQLSCPTHLISTQIPFPNSLPLNSHGTIISPPPTGTHPLRDQSSSSASPVYFFHLGLLVVREYITGEWRAGDSGSRESSNGYRQVKPGRVSYIHHILDSGFSLRCVERLDSFRWTSPNILRPAPPIGGALRPTSRCLDGFWSIIQTRLDPTLFGHSFRLLQP